MTEKSAQTNIETQEGYTPRRIGEILQGGLPKVDEVAEDRRRSQTKLADLESEVSGLRAQKNEAIDLIEEFPDDSELPTAVRAITAETLEAETELLSEKSHPDVDGDS